VAVRLRVCFAIKCGGCKIEAEKFIRRRPFASRGQPPPEFANSLRKAIGKSGVRGQSGRVFLILFALFHAIFDFISPAEMGEGKQPNDSLYIFARAGLD
jgi:hypothetical protein